jgi:hypothetical protein
MLPFTPTNALRILSLLQKSADDLGKPKGAASARSPLIFRTKGDPMKRLTTYATMICIALLAACAKQQPTDKPGAAAITNIKQSLRVAQIAIIATRALLPTLKLDAQDAAVANGVLNDVATARDSLSARIAGYDHFDSSNAAEIKQAAQDALATLSQLNDTGVTHIKNPQAKQQISAAIAALQVVIDMVFDIAAKPPAAA